MVGNLQGFTIIFYENINVFNRLWDFTIISKSYFVKLFEG